jgi:hypothetical protein
MSGITLNNVDVIEFTFHSGATGTAVGTPADVSGLPTVGIQVTGITTATVTFQGTIDKTNWEAVEAVNMGSAAVGTQATADGIYSVPTAGLKQLRANITVHTSGEITITGLGTSAPNWLHAPTS